MRLFKTLSIGFLLVLSLTTNAQTDSTSLSQEDLQGLMKQLQKALKMDFADVEGRKACDCISSISIVDKSKEDVSKEIGACIEKRITDLIVTEAAGKAIFDTNNVMNVNTEDQSARKDAYFRMERFLRDSCTSLNEIINTNEKESLNSVSDNSMAIGYYNDGQDAFKAKNLKKAVYFFQKAVKEDDNFAFAWDNLGLSYRYLKKYDKALAAYKKSLKVSPNGPLPLQNIPVVYEHMKKPQLALDAYNRLTKLQPDNPEGYFGKGRLLISSFKNPTAALHNMCQAYNLYKKTNNPYRADAEKVMGYIHSEMKSKKDREKFDDILKQYKINIRFAD